MITLKWKLEYLCYYVNNEEMNELNETRTMWIFMGKAAKIAF